VLKTTAITWDGWNETAHKVLPRAYWGRHEIEVKTGDVLVTKAGPRDRVGVVVYVKSEPRHLIVSGKMIGLRLRHEEILPQVLAGVLSLRGPQEYIHARTTGMAESQVNFANDVLLNTEVCIPSLPEQFCIAAVLDTIDEAIAKTEAVIAKLKQVRAGLLHDLLTRGLDENGQLRDPVAHPEQFKDSLLGRIPREWNVATFAELLAQHILSDIQDGNHGELHPKESDFVDDGIPFIMATDIAPGRLNLENCKRIPESLCNKLRVGHSQPGDVLLSHKASVGFVARVAPEDGNIMLTPQVTYYRIANPNLLDSEFLCWVMRGESFQRQLLALAAQSTRDYVGITLQRNMSISVPKRVAEQNTVALRLRTATQVIDSEERELQKLLNLKSGLMNDLLTGRVRVPEGLR
jgi:type I restriction enzyme S subunit